MTTEAKTNAAFAEFLREKAKSANDAKAEAAREKRRKEVEATKKQVSANQKAGFKKGVTIAELAGLELVAGQGFFSTTYSIPHPDSAYYSDYCDGFKESASKSLEALGVNFEFYTHAIQVADNWDYEGRVTSTETHRQVSVRIWWGDKAPNKIPDRWGY